MKRMMISLIALILVAVTGLCQAASYTLPEKMYNQLAIGSGLKGTFTITAEGEKFRTPFLNAVTDAEFSLRGISSGKDYHYYVFQTDENEQQTGLSELYRREGITHFRSDMVPGKILAFPTLIQYVEALFPPKGENASSSSFVSKIISLPETERKEKWDPVLTRYQNELEMWLAEFTVNADTVKLDTGLSALDFTYEIPMSRVNEKIVSLFGEFASDPEMNKLLDSVMTKEEKQLYANGNLLYFYQEALNTLDLNMPVRMNKRVSAMGDLLRFRLEMPLDERTTGYSSFRIETIGKLTVYTLRKTGQTIVLGIPAADTFKQTAYEQSVWYANIMTEEAGETKHTNRAVRIDIRKTNEVHEEDEKTHETDHYSLNIVRDTSYLPEDTDLSAIPDSDPVSMEIDLHYSSKYAQNSATTLDLTAEVRDGDSTLNISARLKTSAPWLFMPFDVIDPEQTGTDKANVIDPYLTDWISNASSIIRHTNDPAETVQETIPQKSDAPNAEDETEMTEETDADAETAPLEETDQE